MLRLQTEQKICSVYKYAAMAELADALDSGSSEDSLMEVQVLLAAPVRPRKSGVVINRGVLQRSVTNEK